jgi:cyclophilin family peptidyl-prolyl cis-trans isomerase
MKTIILLTLFFLIGFGQKEKNGQEVGVIETNMGKIVVAFYEKEAPQHIANFKKLAKEGFYNGCTFHRVIPGFVIQGGDPNSKDDDPYNDGTGGPGYTIPAEIKMPHIKGALAAARLSDQVNPERRSSGSQFYIALEPLKMLDGQYTVFGYVIEGMDVCLKIANVERNERDNPINKVIIKKIYIEKRK